MWDVSRVTNMDATFKDDGAFNADITKWNVAKVTSAKDMFHLAKGFGQDLSRWNVEKLANVAGMFEKVNMSACIKRSITLAEKWSRNAAFKESECVIPRRPFIGQWGASRLCVIVRR